MAPVRRERRMGIDDPTTTPSPDDPPRTPDVSATGELSREGRDRFAPADSERISSTLEPAMPNLPAGETEYYNYQPMGLLRSHEPHLADEMGTAERLGAHYVSARD